MTTEGADALVRTRRLPIVSDAAGDGLARELMGHIRGEVRFDQGTRAMYATAASNYRQMPVGVVVPKDAQDVIATLDACRSAGAAVLCRGGGTSLAGQTSNAAVVIDFSKYMSEVISLDPARKIALVQPGLVLDDLRSRAEEHGLTFGPDPSTHNRCTLGGMIGNNSCGVHSVMSGCTADNVEELDVLTYSGARFTVGATDEKELQRVLRDGGPKAEIYAQLKALRDRYADAIRSEFPNIPRRVSGYNLPALLPEHGFNVARALVGSEGTLATVVTAAVNLVASPRHRRLVVLGYDSVFEAGDHVLDVLEHRPIGLEGVDDVLVEAMKRKRLHPESVELLPPGKGWLLAEVGGDTPEQAREQAETLAAALRRTKHPPSIKLMNREEADILWTVRESGLGATARVPGESDTWEGWEDASVPPAQLGGYLRDFRALLERYELRAALYGHFGQGCVHTRIPFDLRSKEGLARYRSFVEEAADLVVARGGSLSGEHGDGQSRGELLPKMFSPELIRAFEELKAIWDPTNKLNPGKVVHPYRIDENLRLGPEYQPPELATFFKYPDDRRSYARATERCVGVGECRRTDQGVMCPSFMVTREEAHSTRGRARLLFEMLRGGLSNGWKSEPVRDALELCLSCKACKSECPVGVDIATYKSEFLAHYYARRLRPRSAYVFGLIDIWARIGALAPRLINALTRSAMTSWLVKKIGGIARERALPALATRTFRAWFDAHPRPDPADRAPCVLWVDTFNDHFQPEVLIAAVEVLERAGFAVSLPPAGLCCGRPLYDYGMLKTAQRRLRAIVEALRPVIEGGMPLVGLEPSCVAVLRDELVELFPDDPNAKALAERTFTLEELLHVHRERWKDLRLHRTAIVQGHCHQRAVMGLEAQAAVLAQLGLAANVLDAGCCGMAGGFGYEASRYPVSVACGERKLLPAIRSAPRDVLVIADGFSCRQQIEQLTDRRALHLAQVLQMAALQGPRGPESEPPEEGYTGGVDR